jgi:hypothetical protein
MDLAIPQGKIGELINDSIKALLDARSRTQGRFTDTDENWGVAGAHGPFTSMQGIRTVLGAIGALADDEIEIWGTIDSDIVSIFEEWREVLSELEREGYGARPYDKKADLTEVLREAGLGKNGAGEGYVETISWSLSTAVLFNYTARVLQTKRRLSPDTRLLESTRQEIGRALTQLLDAQCDDGGWSWARGAGEGHLYFTWSAVQGLADYLDYVVGESEDKINVPPDHEVVAWLGTNFPDLSSRVDQARRRALDFLVRRYLAKELDTGLELADFTVAKRIEPVDRNDARVIVYYELYLLETLILLSYDLPGGVVSPPHRANLAKLYKRLVDQLLALGNLPENDAFWTDADASTLRFRILSKKLYQGKPYSFIVQDPGLWPQFLRTMILYRFYTEPGTGPDAELVGSQKSALHLLVEDQRKKGESVGDGLWDKFAFNLAITARSIEALIDVYDYYQLLAHREARPWPAGSGDLAAMLAEAVYPHLSTRLTATLSGQTANLPADVDTFDLQHELRALVRKEQFNETLAKIIKEALFPLKEWGGPTRDDLLIEFLGKGTATQLQHDDPEAHDLLTHLVWLIFCLCVRLLPLIVAEAAIFQVAETEEAKQFRYVEADSSKGRQTLADRIKLALQELMGHEIFAAEKRPSDPPSYRELVKGLLAQLPASKAKGK